MNIKKQYEKAIKEAVRRIKKAKKAKTKVKYIVLINNFKSYIKNYLTKDSNNEK